MGDLHFVNKVEQLEGKCIQIESKIHGLFVQVENLYCVVLRT